MIEKLKAICLSKTNILAVSLSIFAFLKDIQDLITGFASHLTLVIVSLVAMIIMLIYNLHISKEKLHVDKWDQYTKEKIKSKFFTNAFPKVLFSTILFLIFMTIGSLYYVKNMGVYYVVLEKHLTFEQAKNLKIKTNSSSEFIQLGLSTRFIPIEGGEYELILFNGYINESNADSDLMKVKSLNLGFNPYKVGPQYVANYMNKIRYLQRDIFN